MQFPVLVIAATPLAEPAVSALEQTAGARVEVASSRRSGMAALRRGEYALVLLEERLAAADPRAVQGIYQKALATPVLELSLDSEYLPHTLRQVRTAILRRAHDQAAAERTVRLALQNELKSSLTALLLESQLALREVPPAHAAKLRQVVALADALRLRLNA